MEERRIESLTTSRDRRHPKLIGQIVAYFKVLRAGRKGFGERVGGWDFDAADIDEDEVAAGGFDELVIFRSQSSSQLLFCREADCLFCFLF